MNRKALFGVTSIAALSAATMVAAPAFANGRPSSTGAGCKPAVAVIVKGTANSDGTTSPLSLTVTGGNHFASQLFAKGTSAAVNVTTTASTPVTVGGAPSTLGSIKKGDTVLLQYRVCKADLKPTAQGASPTTLSTFIGGLTARKVVDLGTT
jgi:hypothetical protein